MTDSPTPSFRPELGHELRVFGPPGTGKTTWLAERIRDTSRARGSDQIVVASFTRTAATEIAGRGLPIPRQQVGTLHSIAYRSIGSPDVHLERLSEWNSANPSFRITADGTMGRMEEAPGEAGFYKTDGDALLNEVDALRARMIDPRLWPERARAFSERWELWKQEADVVDFTDMIELALFDGGPAPGEPVVGFFDEVQDFTPIELALVRSWGSHMERVILAGDDDQAIYGFKGASPDAFLDPPVGDEQKRILSQSYRVPVAVHELSQRWVQRLSRREPKDYAPRNYEGAVRSAPFTHAQPHDLVRELADQVADGRSVMVLSTCSYMLDPVVAALRDEGLPFHNPYRRHAGKWNPLRPAAKGSQSAADRVLAYLVIDERLFGDAARFWTGSDVRSWAKVIRKQGVFKRGAAGRIEGLPDRELTYEELVELFPDPNAEALDQILEPSLDWFTDHLLAGDKGRMEFPIQVVRKHGPNALRSEPLITVGTIHSVKGGQADVVYLFPDLSRAGFKEWSTLGEQRDGIIRLFYVGMTRAREELVVCRQSTPITVSPSSLVDPELGALAT